MHLEIALEIHLLAHEAPKTTRLKIVIRVICLVAFYALLLVGGTYLGNVIRDLAGSEFRTIHAPNLHLMILGAAFIFALASALPFVPGAEIGFGMLVLLGGKYALLVFLCMLFALMLAFSIGRLVPLGVLARGFSWLNLEKARTLIETMERQSPETRLKFLFKTAPRRFVPFLLRYRYIALLVLINTPGNSLIGGGGGIALIAGLSGLFKWHLFALTMVFAIAPIPIAFYLMA